MLEYIALIVIFGIFLTNIILIRQHNRAVQVMKCPEIPEPVYMELETLESFEFDYDRLAAIIAETRAVPTQVPSPPLYTQAFPKSETMNGVSVKRFPVKMHPY